MIPEIVSLYQDICHKSPSSTKAPALILKLRSNDFPRSWFNLLRVKFQALQVAYLLIKFENNFRCVCLLSYSGPCVKTVVLKPGCLEEPPGKPWKNAVARATPLVIWNSWLGMEPSHHCFLQGILMWSWELQQSFWAASHPRPFSHPPSLSVLCFLPPLSNLLFTRFVHPPFLTDGIHRPLGLWKMIL